MRPELDLAGVEPFPDLEVALPRLDMSFEGAVVPCEDRGSAAVFRALLGTGVADPDAGEDAGAERMQDQEHLALLERNSWVVASLDERRIGERIVAAERDRDLPAAAGRRFAGRLGREQLAVFVMLPARRVQRRGIKVERQVLQRHESRLDVPAGEIEIRKTQGDPPPAG